MSALPKIDRSLDKINPTIERAEHSLEKGKRSIEHNIARQYDLVLEGLDKRYEGSLLEGLHEMGRGVFDPIAGLAPISPFEDSRPLLQRIQEGEYSGFSLDPTRNPRVLGSILGMAAIEGAGNKESGGAKPGGRGGCGTAKAAEVTPPGGTADAVDLQPYRKGRGRHLPAKSAFEKAKGYDAKSVLAIPNGELERLRISHDAISGAQNSAYRAFAKTGGAFGWGPMEEIETRALVHAGLDSKLARATVQKAIKELKNSGVSAPTRIPWQK